MRAILRRLELIATLVYATHVDAKTYVYSGFRFDTSAIAGKLDEAAVLSVAREQVAIVENIGFTSETLSFFKGFLIRLSEGTGGGNFGLDGISVNLPPQSDSRPILLHELMHAYERDRLKDGMNNRDVHRFFMHAQSGAMWPSDSYMLRDEGEFFAMTTSVELYGRASRPPFTRETLEARQPKYATWIRANIR